MPSIVNMDDLKKLAPDLAQPDKLVAGLGRDSQPQVLAFIVCGNTEAVKLLIDHGASLNFRTSDNSTAVLYAVRSRQNAILRLLLNATSLKAETLSVATTKRRFTPLSYAIQDQNVEAVQLLAAKADLDLKSTDDDVTPVYQAINKVGVVGQGMVPGDVRKAHQIVDILIEQRFDPNIAEDGGITPLMLACEVGLPHVVTRLLKAGADPNRRTQEGHTALFHAAQTGDVALVRVLVASGAKKDIRDGAGRTAYDFALKHENRELRELLKN